MNKLNLISEENGIAQSTYWLSFIYWNTGYCSLASFMFKMLWQNLIRPVSEASPETALSYIGSFDYFSISFV